MNRFQSNHLLALLHAYERDSVPLDLFAHRYFRAHRALGSHDRKEVTSALFGLIRWKGLLDFLLSTSATWEERLALFQKIDLFSFASRTHLPLAHRVSFPPWLVDRLTRVYGEEATTSFCLASNQKAPITIRANRLKTSRAALVKRLAPHYAVSPCARARDGITFHQPIRFTSLPEFHAGLFEVQDEGSQLIAEHVQAKPGDHVLDYCAGSGGKTLAFAPRLQGKGQIYLYDIRSSILRKAKARLHRAGIQHAQMIPHAELNHPRFRRRMDWVLLDVPCSGSGTFRRHPDMKWRLTPKTLDHLVQEQRAIFASALKYVRPHGTLVYATCSVFPEENEEQIHYFTRHYPLRVTLPFFHSLPKQGGMDGFFCAVLSFNPSTERDSKNK